MGQCSSCLVRPTEGHFPDVSPPRELQHRAKAAAEKDEAKTPVTQSMTPHTLFRADSDVILEESDPEDVPFDEDEPDPVVSPAAIVSSQIGRLRVAQRTPQPVKPQPQLSSSSRSVQSETYMDFQRVKLQLLLKQNKRQKEHRREKKEDRAKDLQNYKALWREFQRMPPPTRKRSNSGSSFDLANSEHWYFDFQGGDFDEEQQAPVPRGQASLSLLSESSLEVQRRLFALKRKQVKAGLSSSASVQSAGASSVHSTRTSRTDYGPTTRTLRLSSYDSDMVGTDVLGDHDDTTSLVSELEMDEPKPRRGLDAKLSSLEAALAAIHEQRRKPPSPVYEEAESSPMDENAFLRNQIVTSLEKALPGIQLHRQQSTPPLIQKQLFPTDSAYSIAGVASPEPYSGAVVSPDSSAYTSSTNSSSSPDLLDVLRLQPSELPIVGDASPEPPGPPSLSPMRVTDRLQSNRTSVAKQASVLERLAALEAKLGTKTKKVSGPTVGVDMETPLRVVSPANEGAPSIQSRRAMFEGRNTASGVTGRLATTEAKQLQTGERTGGGPTTTTTAAPMEVSLEEDEESFDQAPPDTSTTEDVDDSDEDFETLELANKVANQIKTVLANYRA